MHACILMTSFLVKSLQYNFSLWYCHSGPQTYNSPKGSHMWPPWPSCNIILHGLAMDAVNVSLRRVPILACPSLKIWSFFKFRY